MLWKTIALLTFIVFLYIVLGGLVYNLVEHRLREKPSIQTRLTTHHLAETFLAKNPSVGRSELEALLKAVQNEEYMTELPYLNNTTELPYQEWDIINSIFFASTVVTTLGYGHQAPCTLAGRLFTCFYCFWGVPLAMILLAAIGEKLNAGSRCCMNICSLHRRFPRVINTVRLVIVVAIGNIFFVQLPTIAFMKYEGWTYEDSNYYAIISLFTIGFGDFVAGVNPQLEYPIWYRPFRQVWLFLGLAWLAFICSVKIDLFKIVNKHRETNGAQNEASHEQKDDDCSFHPSQDTARAITSSSSHNGVLLRDQDESRTLLTANKSQDTVSEELLNDDTRNSLKRNTMMEEI